MLNICFDTNGDDAYEQEEDDHSALNVVGDEGDAEATERGVDCCYEGFDDEGGEAIQACQGIDDLLQCRELGDHVEEEGDKALMVSIVLVWNVGLEYVKALRYKLVITPYRCLVHSVKTKPSGHLRRIMGPSQANTSKGKLLANAYTTSPCTPAIVAICG